MSKQLKPVPSQGPDIHAIAAEALALLDTGSQAAPFSSRFARFDVDCAYRVAATVRATRERRGEKVVGRKIGFTNKAIWPEYNVHGPIWGYMYDRTVRELARAGEEFSLARLVEPRIEPEIVLGLAREPAPDMNEKELLGCVEWIAHGFEIAQSPFPGWKFSAADSIAACGLHGALLVGSRHRATTDASWTQTLPALEVQLYRDDALIDRGSGANVLGGPLRALGHLVGLLARDRANPPLAAGDMVTTGSLTRAFPIAAGETWYTRLSSVPLEGARVRFR
jgi:2-oxo-3-hexenedioate decarboxylase